MKIIECVSEIYSRTTRYYHSWQHHIAPILPIVENISKEMWWAWMFHDVVYDPRAAPLENEFASAELARSVHQDSGINLDIDHVHKLILATAHNQFFPNPDCQLICDLDLLSLSLPAPLFLHNNKLIRLEYLHVSDEEFMFGRRKFFQQFLERRGGTIYFTSDFADYNPLAIANLNRFLLI